MGIQTVKLKSQKYSLPYENNRELSVLLFASEKTARIHISKHFVENMNEVLFWEKILGSYYRDLVDRARNNLDSGMSIKEDTLSELYRIISKMLFRDLKWIFEHPQYFWYNKNKNKYIYNWDGFSRSGYSIIGISMQHTKLNIMTVHVKESASPRDPNTIKFLKRRYVEKLRRSGATNIKDYCDNSWLTGEDDSSKKRKSQNNPKWKQMLKKAKKDQPNIWRDISKKSKECEEIKKKKRN